MTYRVAVVATRFEAGAGGVALRGALALDASRFAVTILAMTLPDTFVTHGWYTPRHILKSLAFIAFTDGEMPVVYMGWSLEYEMYFYLTVALLMALTCAGIPLVAAGVHPPQ